MFISKNEEIIDTLCDMRSIDRGPRDTGGVSGDALVCVILKLFTFLVAS
jgi:hypothetical protein